MVLRRFYSPDDTGGGAADDKKGNAGGGAKGGNDDGGGGANADDDDGDTDDSGDDGGDNGETVAKADHQRALDDLARFKKDNRSLKSKYDDLEKRFKALEKGKSPDGEDWQKKYEESEAKAERLRQNYVEGEKYKALIPALQALGLRKGGEKIIDTLDLDDLEVEISDRGRVTVHNVEAFAKKVKQENDFAFEVKKSSQVNSGGGGRGGGGGGGPVEWTPEKLVEFERKCKREGTPEKYAKAFNEYLEQRKARKKA